MTIERFFPFTAAALYVFASIVYAIKGDWRNVVIWLCFAIANIAISW